VVETSVSFSILNQPSFLNLLYKLDRKYVPPDRKTIRNRIGEEYKDRFLEIKNIMKIASKINLTCDIWTSIVIDPYLGVTAHYVDSDWQMRSHILDVSLFPHPHDSLSIKNAIKEVKFKKK
jgi:hypothetical protein